MSAPDARYVVTGASGWVGQAMLHALAARLGEGWAERTTLFGASERAIAAPGGLRTQRALSTLRPVDVDGATVLHLAFLGREKGDGEVAAFRAANRAIDATMAAALRQARAAGVFVCSSGAARMAESGQDPHPYGQAKLEQEALFAELGAAGGAPVLIGRVYNLAGPYMNKLEGYALSSFLLQARRTGTIRIEAVRPTFRAYLHALDLCALALGALERGLDWRGPRDLCGAEGVEMRDVAIAAARATGLDPRAIVRGEVEVDRPSAYLGDPAHTNALSLALGLTLVPFEAQVRDTARWLADLAAPSQV